MLKNKTLLTLAVIGSAAVANAQITYTGNNFPVAGDIIQLSSSAGTGYTISPASATAQSWDFSTLQPILQPQDDTVKAASTGSAASQFPTADIIRPFMQDLGGSAYINVTSTKMERVGAGIDLFNFSLFGAYTNEHILQEAPVTYNDQNSDTYTASITEYVDSIPGLRTIVDSLTQGNAALSNANVERIRITISGTESREIDAFGSLRLLDSVRNVLRQKSTIYNTIKVDVYATTTVLGTTIGTWVDVTSLLLGALPVPVNATDTTIRYDFLANGYKQPLLMLYPDASDSTKVDIIRFMPTDSTNTISGLKSMKVANIASVYPNPTKASVNVQIEKEGLFNAEIYTATGQMVRNYTNLQQGVNQIELNNLPASNYVLVLKNKAGVVQTRQWVVKQ